MKKWFGSLLLATVIAGGLTGCSSEEDSVVMAPVPDVKSQFKPESDWSTSVSMVFSISFLNSAHIQHTVRFLLRAVMVSSKRLIPLMVKNCGKQILEMNTGLICLAVFKPG